MAKRAGLGYFKVLREFIQDSNCGKVRPFLTTIIKKYGLTAPTVGKILVRYLCMENRVDGALSLINKLNRNNFKVNFPVDVIGMLTEQGRSLDAFKLILGAENNLPSMDVFDYSIIIDGLCKEGFIANAIELSNFARKRGVTLNVVTYNSLFNGLCRQSCLVEAFRLFDSLERNNISPSDITYGTLIDALVREGFLVNARQLFDRMILKDIVPNTHIYNSLIDGYCKFRNLEEALRLVHDMESKSLKPDKFTVSAIIYGFSLEGDIEGALQFFIDMKNNGFPPDFLGFLYLIRGLSSKGRMEEARSVLREMLQDASVVELINRVDVEIENESIESFLVHLCEQGSIQGALLVLNEIGSIFFPSKRNSPSSIYKQSLSSEEDLHTFPLKHLTSFHHMKFDVLYLQVASLCSDGDFEGANALAKGIISSIVRNQ